MEPLQNKIDEYILGFPADIRAVLEQVRLAIRNAAPEAVETIKYGIPTFVLEGNLVHFAGYKTHIGFYPAPSGIVAFKKELSGYKGAKGSIQFPLNQPIPLDLIASITEFRVHENKEMVQQKKAIKDSKKGKKQ